MRKLAVPVLRAAATVVGVAAWVVTGVLLDRGTSLLGVPWTVPTVLGVVAVAVIALGRRVKQFQDGDRPDLDPLEAARTAVLAQAAAYSGSVLAGVYVGYAVALGDMWGHEPRREVAISAAVAAVAAIALTAAGWVAERWCITGGDDGDRTGSGGSAAAGAA